MGSGLVTWNTGYPLKSKEEEEGGWGKTIERQRLKIMLGESILIK